MEMLIVSPGGKKINAFYKGFTIKTDQSKEYGGEGSAPEPFDMFLVSIGTCVGANVIVFCKKRVIPTEKIKLILQFLKNQKTRMIEKVTIEVQLPQEFPEKYKDALVRSAELCAVKKHLNNQPEFEIYTKF